MNGKFDVCGFANDLVVGFDYSYIPTDSSYASNAGDLVNGTFLSPVNIPPPSLGPASDVNTSLAHYSQDYANVYLNDLFGITDKFKLSAGVSQVRTHSEENDPAPSSFQNNQTQQGTAYRAGPLYEIVPGVTAFASYATTYVPQVYPYTAAGDRVLPAPLQGDQVEGGVKVAIVNKASITGTVYQLTEKNLLIPSPDPALAAEGYRIALGEARSHGVELDGTYVPLPGWNIAAAYAYTIATALRSSNIADVGRQFANVPHHAGSLWSTYAIQGGALKGLEAGGGLYSASQRKASLDSSYEMPGYATFNAFAAYVFAGWRASVNITNLFDHRYFQSATSDYSVYFGAPRVATFRIQKTFK